MEAQFRESLHWSTQRGAVALEYRHEAELKMLRFLLGVTRTDEIRSEYVRGAARFRCFGDKRREDRLRRGTVIMLGKGC